MKLNRKLFIGLIGSALAFNVYANDWQLFANIPSAGIKSTNSPVTVEFKTGKFEKQDKVGQMVVHIPLAYAKKHGFLKKDIQIDNDVYKITNSVGYLVLKGNGRLTLLTPPNVPFYIEQNRDEVKVKYAAVDQEHNRAFDNMQLAKILSNSDEGQFEICILSMKQVGFCQDVIKFQAKNVRPVMDALVTKFTK